MLFVQKMVMGLLMLALSVTMWVMGAEMPQIRSMGDVGAAFLPKIVAICGACLALLYMFMVARGRDGGGTLIHPISLVLCVLFMLIVGLVPWLGLPLAAGLGATATVLLLERGGHIVAAVVTGVFFGLLTEYGFGMLLGVPLP